MLVIMQGMSGINISGHSSVIRYGLWFTQLPLISVTQPLVTIVMTSSFGQGVDKLMASADLVPSVNIMLYESAEFFQMFWLSLQQLVKGDIWSS